MDEVWGVKDRGSKYWTLLGENRKLFKENENLSEKLNLANKVIETFLVIQEFRATIDREMFSSELEELSILESKYVDALTAYSEFQ